MKRMVRKIGIVSALVVCAVMIIGSVVRSATLTGPSTLQSPYVLPSLSVAGTASVLSVGDLIGGYRMTGIPDGLGAFDNGDGTFTLLMNHELTPTEGAVHDHGSTGAFVSRLVIDKATLEVVQASDLIQTVHQYD